MKRRPRRLLRPFLGARSWRAGSPSCAAASVRPQQDQPVAARLATGAEVDVELDVKPRVVVEATDFARARLRPRRPCHLRRLARGGVEGREVGVQAEHVAGRVGCVSPRAAPVDALSPDGRVQCGARSRGGAARASPPASRPPRRSHWAAGRRRRARRASGAGRPARRRRRRARAASTSASPTTSRARRRRPAPR